MAFNDIDWANVPGADESTVGGQEQVSAADFNPNAAMNDAIGCASHDADKEEQAPWRAVRANRPRPLKPVLIDGLLRRGLVMIVSAKGKIGKTYLCIQLALSVAFGLKWLGRECTQGRVLFINPEVDEDSFDNRMSKVCEQMAVNKLDAEKLVDVWNTRKEPVTIGQIIEQVEKFASDGCFSLIILDSVSCYLEGDESKSIDVRNFTGEVNRLAETANAGIVMIQHYGKGNQGDRDAGDRARGSSVWLDAPDTALTITELYPPSGEVEDYLEKDESAFKVECAGMRDFGPFDSVNIIRKHPLVRIDEDGITSGWTFSKAGNGKPGGEAKAKVRAAEDERDFAIYQNKIVADLMQRDDGDDGISCKDASELVGIDTTKASQKLKDLFIKYGEPGDYMEGDFNTKAYSTDLLVLRKRPSKRPSKANPGKESQGYYIFPRFRTAQLELDVDD